MKRLIIATVSGLIIVSSINTRVAYCNGLDKPTQSHLVSELTKANKDALSLQKCLDMINKILRECKPMTSKELDQLLK